MLRKVSCFVVVLAFLLINLAGQSESLELQSLSIEEVTRKKISSIKEISAVDVVFRPGISLLLRANIAISRCVWCIDEPQTILPVQPVYPSRYKWYRAERQSYLFYSLLIYSFTFSSFSLR